MAPNWCGQETTRIQFQNSVCTGFPPITTEPRCILALYFAPQDEYPRGLPRNAVRMTIEKPLIPFQIFKLFRPLMVFRHVKTRTRTLRVYLKKSRKVGQLPKPEASWFGFSYVTRPRRFPARTGSPQG